MRKGINRSVIIAMAAMLSAGMLSACGQKGGSQTAVKESVAYEEPSESNAGAGSEEDKSASDTAESGELGGEGTGETYVDLQPVAKNGYITAVDEANKRITFSSEEYAADEDGNYNEVSAEIILNYTDGTPVLDAGTLEPVSVSDIDTSKPVYVWTSQAMTMSIPPQTAAQVIITNVPDDASAPMYVIAKDVKNTDGGIIITDQDGVTWRADGDTEVIPYLTRNIVTLDDIKTGTRLVVSQNSENTTSGTESAGEADAYAAKVLIFAD